LQPPTPSIKYESPPPPRHYCACVWGSPLHICYPCVYLSLFQLPAAWTCRVCPFPPPAVWMCRVYPFHASSIDVQFHSQQNGHAGVSLSTASSMEGQGISPSKAWSMDMQGISLCNRQQCGCAGYIHFHLQQNGRAGCIPFH
jgi:hypothetical protein